MSSADPNGGDAIYPKLIQAISSGLCLPQADLEALAEVGYITRARTFEDHMRPGVTHLVPTEYAEAFEELCRTGASEPPEAAGHG